MDMPQVFDGQNKESPMAPQEIRTEDILAERGKQYGAFIQHAHITQVLKETAYRHAANQKIDFTRSQQEALDMIFHKIGRIVNGNPNHTDSWDDIAGYAKLEADIQRGIHR